MDAVSITDVHKSFPGHWGRGGVYAVKGVSLSIPEGGVYGLIGPNGSGKSTVMKMLVGLLAPDAGECRVFGQPATAPANRREIGFLPENPYSASRDCRASDACVVRISRDYLSVIALEIKIGDEAAFEFFFGYIKKKPITALLAYCQRTVAGEKHVFVIAVLVEAKALTAFAGNEGVEIFTVA